MLFCTAAYRTCQSYNLPIYVFKTQKQQRNASSYPLPILISPTASLVESVNHAFLHRNQIPPTTLLKRYFNETELLRSYYIAATSRLQTPATTLSWEMAPTASASAPARYLASECTTAQLNKNWGRISIQPSQSKLIMNSKVIVVQTSFKF